MPSGTRLIQAALALAAAAIAGEAHAQAAARLAIALKLPEVVVAGELFPVSLEVADPIGVRQIEIRFQGETLRLAGGGARESALHVELRAGEAGFHELEAGALAVDGVRSAPVRTLVAVGDHTSSEPGESLAEVDALVASWRAKGSNPFELYERGPLYAPGPSARVLARRARATRTADSIRDQLLIHFPGLADVLIPFNWWKSWVPDGRQPFDWNTHCGPLPGITPSGEVLECWLSLHPLVRSTMVWQIVEPGGQVTQVTYDDWPILMKFVLNGLFYSYWTWLQGGLATGFPDVQLATPPVNGVQLQDGQSAVTRFAGTYAVALYLHSVAHSLALEIGGFVPWSFLSYNLGDVARLLSSTYLLEAGNYAQGNVGNPTPVVFTGYWPYGDTTHAPPTKTFQWLVDHDVLRPTHYDTVARLLKWGRENMLHYGGFAVAENMENHWQYRGDPPVARMLDLTPRLSPPGGPAAWAAGCHGVSFFMQSLLRAANIPVSTPPLVDPNQAPAHRSPVFQTAGQALSHGDDVYGVKFDIPSVDPSYLPPDALFVPHAIFSQWFPGDAASQTRNVGRQVREIALDILPNNLMDIHCDDLKGFKSHAASGIASFFQRNYSVGQLEGMGLWTRLYAKEAAFDFCDEPLFLYPALAAPMFGP